MLGGVGGDTDPTVLSALLRTWEARFAAVTFEVGQASLRVSVGRPPVDYDAALSLAAELCAISNDDSDLVHLSLEEIANDLAARLLTRRIGGRRARRRKRGA